MDKNYLHKDFFLTKEGKDAFELQTSQRINHLCVTDESDEVIRVDESITTEGIKKITEIVVGLGDHIPLWKRNTILKWRISPSFNNYSNSRNIKNYIREILAEAVIKWGDASPVKFQESDEHYDFEIIMRPDNCNAYGCTLASAFFPNPNINILTLYPKMFKQSRFEQVETMIHEIGHIFGLRHYFAKEREASWRSEVFGHHYPLTIMNYGHNSTLTEQDKIDLKKLYSLVWNGQLTNINGMPIKLYNSYTQS